jgi:hypothetical protein
VGAGLLAKAVDQSKWLWLTHRFREQARSHIGFVVLQVQYSRHKKTPRIVRYAAFFIASTP